MTATRRISLDIITDETGTKCAAECPCLHDQGMIVCTMFRDDCGEPLELGHYKDPEFRRRGECIAAESAAIDLAIEAMRSGFGIAAREAYTEAIDIGSGAAGSPRIWWDFAGEVLDAEIKRIRGGS